MLTAESLYASPNALAGHYRKFRVGERFLLTGHSHQAWPDCGLDGQRQAWLDAAEYLDHKWDHAFARAERVRRGFARLLDDPGGHIALGSNTHELVVRFLSALPLARRPRIITTDGEFHSLRRQLDRMAEEGLELVKVPSTPASQVAERLSATVDDRTAAVIVSAVFYQTGQIVPALGTVLDACRRVGAELLIDAYHALNVVPFSLRQERLDGAFVTGGGYKYCQLGEGNAFLRFPESCRLRPLVTGWFSEFDTLGAAGGGGAVVYGNGQARFAGATYDPSSHYRAAEVFDFFKEQDLSPEFLRAVSQHQLGLLAACFDRLDADPDIIRRDRSIPMSALGGFLVLRSPLAAEICRLLGERGVSTDYRDDALRLGPAPYLSDDQLKESMRILGDALQGGMAPALSSNASSNCQSRICPRPGLPYR
jgi:kynureninase